MKRTNTPVVWQRQGLWLPTL